MAILVLLYSPPGTCGPAAAPGAEDRQQAGPAETARSSPPPIPAPRDDLVEVPAPDLSTMEPMVVDQVRSLYDEATKVVEHPRAGDEVMAEAYSQLGQTFHAYELLDPAEACYRNASHLAPTAFDWVYLHADVLRRQGDLDGAVADLERACAMRPEYVPCMVRIGTALLELNDLDAAEAWLDKALAAAPGLAAAHAGLGDVALARQDYQTAVDHLETALELLPAANSLHYRLARAYRGLGEAELARQHLQQRGTIGVGVPDPLIDGLEDLKLGERVHILRGRRAYAAGDYAAAVESFAEAVAANPRSVSGTINLGTTVAMMGEADRAIELFQRALELEPDSATAHFNLGELLSRQGRPAEARPHLEAVTKLSPSDVPSHLLLAEVSLALGDTETAMEHFKRASEIDDSAERAFIGLARVLDLQGRYAEALQVLEDAHARMPDQGRLANALARVLATSPAASLRDGARALDLAARVMKALPSWSHAETLALALAEAGHCEQAADWQRKALTAAAPTASASTLARMSNDLRRYQAGAPCRVPVLEAAGGAGTPPR
jgi:tetratricopeptide (TPR) repeat protein